jgi:hypothetical protein
LPLLFEVREYRPAVESPRTSEAVVTSPRPKLVVHANEAAAVLAAIRLSMDEYAREIFDLWFGGKAPAEVTFDSPRWAAYMRAEPRLAQQIQTELAVYADLLRNEIESSSSSRLARPFTRVFHAEVGSDVGGYKTGYDVLHGSNGAAGDFVISGQAIAVSSGPNGAACLVTYTNLQFVFNDIVDANRKYNSDSMGLNVAKNLATALHAPQPKDYMLRIKWAATAPVVIPVPPVVKGKGPSWLKTFPNK